MANKKQLTILNQDGVEAWNKWREKNPDIEIDLSDANLSDVDLSGADLSVADLSGANLSEANLREAIFSDANLSDANLSDADLSGADLIRVNLSDAKLSKANLIRANLIRANLIRANLPRTYLLESNLSGANLSDADLSGANLRRTYLLESNLRQANLSRANLSGANLSDADLSGANLRRAYLLESNLRRAYLSGANLSGANLSDADLSRADLSGADLSRAYLRRADLRRAYLLEANLSRVNFTGATIEDWSINSQTILDNVICNYVFLKEGQQERRPSDPNRNFETGELAQLVGRYIETVDLIFLDGIDWKAFLSSLQVLRVKYSEQNVFLQAIEKKSDGSLVIRLSIPSDLDKAALDTHGKQLYKNNLQVLEAQYRAELQAKDREITLYKEQSAEMIEIVKLLASRPINFQAIESQEIWNTWGVSSNWYCWRTQQKLDFACPRSLSLNAPKWHYRTKTIDKNAQVVVLLKLIRVIF